MIFPVRDPYAIGCSLEVFGEEVFAFSVLCGGDDSSLHGGETCGAYIATWGGGSGTLYCGGGDGGGSGSSSGRRVSGGGGMLQLETLAKVGMR